MNECDRIRDRFFARERRTAADPELEAHLAACAACRSAVQAMPAVDRALAQLPKLLAPAPPFEAVAPFAARAARGRRRANAVRRSLPSLLTGLGAAAAAALLVTALIPRLAASSAPLVAVGSRLDAHGGARHGELQSGARLRLDSGMVFRVPAAAGEERLRLEVGSLSLEVPRLPPGRSVSVSTPDAEVLVHGTRFQVLRDARGTVVAVAEGLVEVRPSGGRPALFVRPGESATVESPQLYRRGLRASAAAALGRGAFAAARRPLELLLGSELEPVEEAEARAMLGWALAGEGDRAGAIEQYRRSLALLPEGQRPLWADNACAERALLLEREAPAKAPAAWSQCLSLFPDGVHAARARGRTSAPEP